MRKKITIAFFILGIGVLAARAQTQTASPKIFITWKAQSYAPAQFTGKVLPTANSLITASVEVVDNGKVMDLMKQSSTVYWYANGNFLQGDKALQEMAFRAPDTAGGSLDLRAEIPNYKRRPEDQSIQILKTVTIPIAQAEAVIEAPFPAGKFSAPNIELTAVPYFFNVSDISHLNFNWAVNGQAPSGAENPQKLAIKAGSNAAPGSTIEISLAISNPNNVLQGGSKTITLTYQP